MKSGLSLVQLAQKIEAQRALKQDYITTEARMMLLPGDKTEAPRPTHPELLSANVNTWLSEGGDGNGPKRRMIRTLGGDARAVLSPRYQRIENEHVAEVALPILMNEMPGVQVMSPGAS